MAKIITVAHQKGGVGKSTLALNLASCFVGVKSIALIDADPQGSLSVLKNYFPDMPIIKADAAYLKQLHLLPYELVIVDTPPYRAETLPGLFELSDFILVPTKAGWFDALAITTTIDQIQLARQAKPAIKAGIVLNMIKPRSGITSEVQQALQRHSVPLLETMVHDRVSYSRSPLAGGILDSDDEKAKEEILNLAREIVGVLNK
jgi:chromosome partitioning protein